jgi:precorrin-3B synthase
MSQRRGACPALFTPMQTGDGLLARIVPAERITPAAFAAFCAAARRHGNGTIEVSARGSLQVRGLTAASAPRFADEVAQLGVAALGVPVLSDPLPDDPAVLIDAGVMAAKLRAAIAKADLALAPKVCVIVDGGGSVHLDALTADVRLSAFARDDEIRLALALAGDATTAEPLGSIPIETAVEVVVDVLRVIAARGDVRASDVLRTEGLGAFGGLPHLRSEPVLRGVRAPVEIVGVHPLRDGRAAFGMTLAFGHAQAETLMELADTAAAYGAHSIRPTAGRALLLTGMAKQDVIALAREAEQLGFLTRADDPRRRIVACPGAPACASGFIAARKLASELADLLSPRPEEPGPSGPGVSKDGSKQVPGHPSRRTACGRAPQDEDLNVWCGSGTIHISGCAKGCAHPKPAALTIVGTERGCGVIEEGTARATPPAYVDSQDLAAHLSQRISEPAHG